MHSAKNVKEFFLKGVYMQCYTPLLREFQDISKSEKRWAKENDLKLWQRVYSREYVLSQLKDNENYLQLIKRKNQENAKNGSYNRYMLIPCRHCFACSINYAADWATRMALECVSNGGKHNYFITLTYDEENLPIYEKIDYVNDQGKTTTFYNTGEDTWNTGTLQKDHSQKFIKRLRSYLSRHSELGNFKFYLCGEYGDLGRPHYHAILMDCRLDETQFYDCKIDSNHHDVWKSKELDKLWGKGFVDVAEASWQDMAYTARYVQKKWIKSFKPIDYYINGKEPEFVTMSKGIGEEYWNKYKDKIYDTDSVIVHGVDGKTQKVKPPKRFDSLLKNENEELHDQIKEQRNYIRERMEEILLTKTDLTDLERLRQQEELITTKAKMLKRQFKERY